MLSRLPSEIIYHIAAYLPTANCFVNLSRTCKRLHSVITADGSRIYRAFVHSRFPSVDTPPLWKDAARVLTARSRALDRGAVIARFVVPRPDAPRNRSSRPATIRNDRPTLGYRPVIDSYEKWHGETWAEREEVLVWGAGPELLIQRKHFGQQPPEHDHKSHPHHSGPNPERENGYAPISEKQVTFVSFNDLQRCDSWDDICAVHLLRSTQRRGTDFDDEDIILGRRNGTLSRVLISQEGKSYEYRQSYLTGGRNLERTDISGGPHPVLAATLDRKFVTFFRVCSEESEVQPFASLETASAGSRLLCDDRVAVGLTHVVNNISIFQIGPNSIDKIREIGIDNDVENEYEDPAEKKTHPSTITPLPTTSQTGGNPGDLFLTGWGDSKARLYDLRSRKPHVATFIDTVDDSPIYSIHPFGRDHFLVGSGQDAIVKIFDMRMPGADSYSYLDASSPGSSPSAPRFRQTNGTSGSNTQSQTNEPTAESVSYPRKEISIFLSHQIASGRNRTVRYRGPVYAISSPSPSSSTIYAGVENNILRLDFASTDDLTGSEGSWFNDNLGLDLNLGNFGGERGGAGDHVLNLPCYQRPPLQDLSQGLRLLKQEPFSDALHRASSGGHDDDGGVGVGWDPRWRPPRLEKDGAPSRAR